MPRLFISAALIALMFTPLISGVVNAEDQGQYMGYYAYQQPLQHAPSNLPSPASYPGYAANYGGPPVAPPSAPPRPGGVRGHPRGVWPWPAIRRRWGGGARCRAAWGRRA